jgi:hypothetical protein
VIEEITLEQYHALAKRAPKYGNEQEVVDGITFDSKAEAERYKELKLMERAGEISGLELQPRFVLQEAFTDDAGVNHQAITYVADFRYIERGALVVEDVKGAETAVFKIKAKMFRYRYRSIELRITT